LIQVAADISSPATFEREVRALTEGRKDFPDAKAVLVTETEAPRGSRTPQGIEIVPVWQWLLGC
jgi:predicted AAA+ superfamily ATPase